MEAIDYIDVHNSLLVINKVVTATMITYVLCI